MACAHACGGGVGGVKIGPPKPRAGAAVWGSAALALALACVHSEDGLEANGGRCWMGSGGGTLCCDWLTADRWSHNGGAHEAG